MAGKSLIGQDFAMRQEGGVQLPHSDNRLEYGDLVNGTVFPLKFGGKPNHIVHGEGRPSCHCMALSARSLKCLCFITKTIYNNHIAKINQE